MPPPGDHLPDQQVSLCCQKRHSSDGIELSYTPAPHIDPDSNERDNGHAVTDQYRQKHPAVPIQHNRLWTEITAAMKAYHSPSPIVAMSAIIVPPMRYGLLQRSIISFLRRFTQ